MEGVLAPAGCNGLVWFTVRPVNRALSSANEQRRCAHSNAVCAEMSALLLAGRIVFFVGNGTEWQTTKNAYGEQVNPTFQYSEPLK